MLHMTLIYSAQIKLQKTTHACYWLQPATLIAIHGVTDAATGQYYSCCADSWNVKSSRSTAFLSYMHTQLMLRT